MSLNPLHDTKIDLVIDLVIDLAWADEVSFDEIRARTGYAEKEVIRIMRLHLKPSSFRMWRKRVSGRVTKHKKRLQSRLPDPFDDDQSFAMTAPAADQIAAPAASPATTHATRFASAITRRPAASAVDGLRAEDMGAVDIGLMERQHRDYQDALRAAGAVVIALPPLPAFPDAQFVEDTALCLPGLAVMMRPGVETRRGEVAPMRAALSELFDTIAEITDGFIEAGDILTTPSEVMVGLSARTDSAGAEQLRGILDDHGYAMRVLQTPPDVLHFKTDCSLIDDKTILATERLAWSGCFEGYHTLLVPEGEEPAANMIRYNDHIIMPAGFAKTEAMLKAEGFAVLTVGNSECAKISGGMSCLSLRF